MDRFRGPHAFSTSALDVNEECLPQFTTTSKQGTLEGWAL